MDYLQIRITRSPTGKWSWSVFEYQDGDYILKHLPNGGSYAFTHGTMLGAYAEAAGWLAIEMGIA